MKRVFLFIGLKIAEIIGGVVVFSLLAGIFKLCDIWFFDFYPFREGEYYINPIREWAYCGLWGLGLFFVMGIGVLTVVSVVWLWFSANWKLVNRIIKKGGFK